MKTGKRTNPIIAVLMAALSVAFVYPFYYVLILSFNDAFDSYKGGIYLWPRAFTLDNYKVVFTNPYLMNGYLITVSRVAIMMVAVTFLCSLYAYALIQRNLIFRKFFGVYIIIPMYISGGLIPFYYILRVLHLVDSYLVYIIPYLFVPFYILLFRSYFQEGAPSLREAGIIDGCTEFGAFIRLIFPTSVPVIAVVALFTGVGNWNEWFVGQAFVTDNRLWPLQTIMLQILKSQELKFAGLTSSSIAEAQGRITPESVRLAMIIICVAPILAIYPFLQKYFIHGIMIGAVKE